jgi:nicotinate phosphoribosyltransferase
MITSDSGCDRFSPLFTDLYGLTMMATYDHHHQNHMATFSLFIRGLDSLNRGYFVSAGLDDCLAHLEKLRFSPRDIAYLKQLGRFSPSFIEKLAAFRFTGDVWAMPEGTICFADEPIAEISAPLPQAQLIETAMINIMGFQTMIATKAARCIYAAAGKPLVDFSLRRTQGFDAGMKVARCAFLAGFAGTSNVLAGQQYGIPVSGTMAHSLILAFGGDEEAFIAYARTFPDDCIFLIDTFDIIAGAHAAVQAAKWLSENGHRLKGVRIDSGDMVEESRMVRNILDSAGLQSVQIVVSSGFDEYLIADVIHSGAAIDAFGVGTRFGVSSDAPYLDMVYKLTRYNNRNVRKTSPGKITLAGEKQIFRHVDASGKFNMDTLGARDEAISETRPLLEPVMKKGRRLKPSVPLSAIREGFQVEFSHLGDEYKALYEPKRYPVEMSPELLKLQN